MSYVLFFLTPIFFPFSISQTTGAESQVRAERVEQVQTELESLKHQISTLGQQIDQYEHACNRAKDEQGKIKYANKQDALKRGYECIQN